MLVITPRLKSPHAASGKSNILGPQPALRYSLVPNPPYKNPHFCQSFPHRKDTFQLDKLRTLCYVNYERFAIGVICK